MGKDIMAFEHYTRSGTKMLRCGYTTGTCAALAAAAATRILLCGKPPETVTLMTGKGIPVEVAVGRQEMVALAAEVLARRVLTCPDELDHAGGDEDA